MEFFNSVFDRFILDHFRFNLSNESFTIDYFITADQRPLHEAKLYFQIYNPVEVAKGGPKS